MIELKCVQNNRFCSIESKMWLPRLFLSDTSYMLKSGDVWLIVWVYKNAAVFYQKRDFHQQLHKERWLWNIGFTDEVGSVPIVVTLIPSSFPRMILTELDLSPGLYLHEQHDRSHMWNRIWLTFRDTWYYPSDCWGSCCPVINLPFCILCTDVCLFFRIFLWRCQFNFVLWYILPLFHTRWV